MRELARDFLTDRRLRRDAYSRDGAELDEDGRRARLVAMRYSLAQPAAAVDYRFPTDAGTLSFDNDTARAIVAQLAGGPRRAAELVAAGLDPQDVVANLMALCSADCVRPVAPDDGDAAALNAAVFRSLDGPAPRDVLALCCGTAIRLDTAVLRALHDRGDIVDRPARNWSRYLAIHARR